MSSQSPSAATEKAAQVKIKEKPKPEPIDVIDNTPFPAPEIYFKVYESEEDEPEAKIRRDVNKLYEKWMKEYGRRWPDRGMNTEDLVWLAEEAYKPESGAGVSSIDDRPLGVKGFYPAEEEAYDGEFITEPGEETNSKGKKGPPRPRMSNYEATKAGGVWVTDEFESDEYIAGNLEQMWDMYLWDRDGNPTIMPDGPPDEAAGEESEAFDDFYTAYRPRGVDSDEAREAVWVTDEFESDEDNTESEWEPEYVGAGLGLDAEDPINPQYSLRHSAHPLAPFPGEPLKWASFAYDDGTTFEGLSRDAVPHGMGVMIFGNGTGGGFHFRDVRRADKFEGEFQAGYAHGLGMFTSEMRGEVFIGEFFAGQRHGCGIKIDMKPYYYLLERGDDPVSAYRKTYDQIMRNIEFRTWYRNRPLGSEYEDEVVFAALNADDDENPYDVILRNANHEAKLRAWKQMEPEEKAMTKMMEIVEQVGTERIARRYNAGFQSAGYYMRDEKGRIVQDLDSYGNDTEYDSMDLMVGNTTDGGFGLGWIQDTQDEEDFPHDPKLLEAMAIDVAEDKMEESEDKEGILGEDLLNPFTGLSVKDYLEGKEGKYQELMAMVRPGSKSVGGALKGVGRVFDNEATSYMDTEDMEAQSVVDSALTRQQQDLLLHDMERYDAVYGRSVPYRDVFEEPTDTRFETESDVMELCDLAEILGTVEEAQEVVQKARMWRWKPYGEVTIRYAQDANGTPVELMQDPMHYPHSTKFMAPGPLGQCHPIPDDIAIRNQMLAVAQNYQRIYEMYNFDYDPEPGSAQYIVEQRIKRAQELKMIQLGRMEEAVEEELAESSKTSAANVNALPSRLPALASLGLASTAIQPPFLGHAMGYRARSPFASMSQGMGRASKVIMDALSHGAKHVVNKRTAMLKASGAHRRGRREQ
ncbi:hypothetical protein CEUSTIGMA_g3789.t1 [Chlamydomonas eustigma]|uniref:Uncharacterized protein n=1 Tax=Chlamydomonas eustigma TaxID=1157962 RepID=A0A250WZS0_9CHLO|nr:hypothetical protein CEUSTIGMA_g3789.t1 [Chlamydomonas eustigma]|eukprot:GAX76343.1 hypothetical protein CEUSTIGMA_g3789.t1 [Chlamydomonas eustigma]